MGRWGDGFFDDDLALDIRGIFQAALERGQTPAQANAAVMQSGLVEEILSEFGEDERDAYFWEESGSMFLAIAVLQLEHYTKSGRSDMVH